MANTKSDSDVKAKISAQARKLLANRLPEWSTRLSLDGNPRRKVSIEDRTFSELRREVDEIIRTFANGPERQAWREMDEDFREAVAGRGELLASDDVVFQLRVELVGSDSPIWRRLQIPGRSIDRLHEQLQCAMGWTNSHLHQFFVGKTCYGDPQLLNDDIFERPMMDSTRVTLQELSDSSKHKLKMEYEYDFGDGWIHEVKIEKRLPPDPDVRYPLCLEGENACPPEDCGGIYGYADMLAALNDPEHEEYETFREWIGPFDPTAFDAAAATDRMRLGFTHWTLLAFDGF